MLHITAIIIARRSQKLVKSTYEKVTLSRAGHKHHVFRRFLFEIFLRADLVMCVLTVDAV